MRTLLFTSPRERLATEAIRKLVQSRLSNWRVEVLPSGQIDGLAEAPDVTLVELDYGTPPARLEAMMPSLAGLQARTGSRAYVLFSFREKEKSALRTAEARRELWTALLERIGQSLAAFPNPERVNVSVTGNPGDLSLELEHLRTKLDLPPKTVETPQTAGGPRLSALDQVQEVIRATEDLRVGNGNLSAQAVAEAFGISLNQLAGWLGRSRQALSKTPDADSLQGKLGYFERVARLRAVVPPKSFLKWLRMPRRDLENKTPLQLLAAGEGQAVADLVDDMLTGAPS